MDILTLIPFASFLVYAALAGIVLHHRPQMWVHRTFAIMLSFAAVWSLSSFMLHANFFPGQAVQFYGILILTMFGTVSAYYHFSRAFVSKPAGWVVYAGYGALAVFIILIALGYYIKDVSVGDGFVHVSDNPVLFAINTVILITISFGVLYNFVVCFRNSGEAELRNQVAYVLAGFVVAQIASISNTFPFLRGYPIDQGGMLLNCLIITYAVLRHQLLSIRVILRYGLGWIGLAVVGISAYLLSLLSIQLLFDFHIELAAWILVTLAAVAVAVIIYLLRNPFFEAVNRLFDGERHGNRQKLQDFVRYELSGIFSLRELGEGLLTLLGKSMDCQQAYLLLPGPGRNDFVAEFVQPEEARNHEFRIRQDSPIVAWLQENNRCLYKESMDTLPEFLALWEGERETFKALGIELFFPLVSRDNLAGILALGKRRSGKYLMEDVNLAENTSRQVAVSLEKEHLQEQLKRREEELSVINRLAGVMTSSLNIQEVYDAFVAGLKDVVDVDWATIALIEGDKLYFEALSSTISSAWQQGERIPLEGTGTEWVARYKKPLVEPDFAQKRRFWTGEIHLKQGIRSLVYLPLLVKGDVLGSLLIGSCRPKAYSPEQVDLLGRLALQVGMPVENSRLYAKAERGARVDELTGLFNRRHFDERLRQEIDGHSRYSGVLSLVLLDLDLFKDYNDREGHVAGDKMLAYVGLLIERSVRNADVAFRYGGDEFAVLLPRATSSEAFVVAERVRGMIAAEMGRKQTGITASLGLASWPSDGVTEDAIVVAADKALYYAKRNNGNQTCVVSRMLPSLAETATPRTGHEKEALSTIHALAATIEARDTYTYGHSRKVSGYAVALAEAFGLPSEKAAVVSTAALLHDIGKIGVTDEVLNKPGKLSVEEWEMIKTHPKLSATIVGHVPSLTPCLPSILHHHERWDGTGYPSGLKGEAIPLEARILAIADAFDAMTSPRPYRGPMSYKEALEELKRCSGTQFDSELVKAFLPIALATTPEELAVGEDPESSKADS